VRNPEFKPKYYLKRTKKRSSTLYQYSRKRCVEDVSGIDQTPPIAGSLGRVCFDKRAQAALLI
jgi:hypothetical protein